MKLPKEVTVGKTRYRVTSPVEIICSKDSCRGIVDYDLQLIQVAKQNAYGSYTTAERDETFWHELTHAILDDMGEDKLNRNEKFVTAFSQRLDKAIRTAKFEI
jgi:hypothetical protein